MLTALQERVWRILSALPESEGFALAGGAALIVSGVVQRGTRDLDIFGQYPATVTDFVEAAVRALNDAGLDTTVDRSGPLYTRLDITDDGESTSVDFSTDVRRRGAVPAPRGGQMLHPHELAADKLLALWDRAEPRDFIDLQGICQRHSFDDVIRWAEDKDGGFAPGLLREALERFDHYQPTEFGLTTAGYAELRDFVHDLLESIR